ncbi:SusC/RagA family TonB-linked outer membrane protein [Bacteroidia bacterium]|nr:SusC/RagA family TonB-linked outer membrane protein [Bacteroidia bacterium]
MIDLLKVSLLKANLKKISRMMRFPFLFLLIGTGVGNAAVTYSQVTQLTISMKNKSVKDVFKEIEKNSEYIFFYYDGVLDVSRKVNIQAEKQTVDKILDQLFETTDNTYVIDDRQIFISRKESVKSIETKQLQQQKTRRIAGVVKDNTGEPVIGANVIAKGTTIGNITDANGRFSIDVPENSTLQVSFIGYKFAEVKVGGQDFLNILLTEDAEILDEVVVVGFGTTKRRDVVGSITKIGGDEITKIPTANIAQNLQGMSSGLMVTNASGHPGRAPEIKIRGLNSINLSTDPLWIVDGMPIHTGVSERTSDGIKSISAIAMLNPNDIESIEVLKDAAATSIYGSRAAGGVILVTTKSNKGKLTNVQLSYDGGVSQVPFKQNDIFMDSKTWWDMMDLSATNANQSLTNPDLCLGIQFWGERPHLSKEEAIAANIDQLGNLTQSAFFHQAGLTANKGFETAGVMFSFNYRNEEGLIRNNDFDRITSRFSFNFKPVHSMEVGINSNFIYMKSNGVQARGGKGGAGWDNWKHTLPWYIIYDENSQTGYWAANSGYNMRASTDRNLIRNDYDSYRNMNHAFAQWNTPLPGLIVKGEVGVDLMVTNSSYWRSALLVSQVPYISRAYEQSVTKANMNYDAYTNYSKTFGAHNIDFTAGWEAFRNWDYTRYAEGQDLQTAYPELRNPLTMLQMGGRQGGDQFLMGFFARANYKLLDRYLLNLSVRRDGHAAFSATNRWANFYAAGAGWILTDEAFMKDISWLNLLKLRGSYGTTGNTNVSNSMTYMSWGLNTNGIFGVNYPVSGSSEVGPLGSTSLKWETTANLDLGFDYGLFDNRINGSFAYYTQKISDLILRGSVQPSVGYFNNQIYENIGDLKNWGVEFNISSVNVQNKDFTWKTDFNISTNKNEIIRLNEAERGKGNEESQRIRKEGESLNTWYLANNLGVDTEKGVYMIEQRDADVWNTAYQTVSTGKIIPMTNNNVANNKMIQHGKTSLPKYYGGFTNTFYYKGFDLSVILSFTGGHWLMNNLYEATDQMSSENNSIKDLAGNSWEKPGDKAKYPQVMAGESYFFDNDGNTSATRTQFSSTSQTTRFLERGDYIRLRNLQLGYTLPKTLLNHIKLNSVRFYVGGNNLFTITGYHGVDPETIDDLPIPRTLNFGLSLNL